MRYIDIIIEEDLKKAKQLYKYLQFIGCEDLFDTQLEDVMNDEQPPMYGYRIKQNTKSLEYLYCIVKNEVENPITFEEFVERTVKL